VRAIIITADSLLLRPKLDYDEGNDVAVKGASAVVFHTYVASVSSMLHMFALATHVFSIFSSVCKCFT
jgi:hypothetical protein